MTPEVTPARRLEPITISLLNAARYLDVPYETFAEWLRRGELQVRTVRMGRKVLVVKADLDAWLAQRIENETVPARRNTR